MKTEQKHPSDNAKQDPLLSRRDAVKGFARVGSAMTMGGALTSQAAEPQPSDPCQPKNPYDSTPGSGISMPRVWTGDGKPDQLTAKFAKGADLFVSEMVVDNPALWALKQWIPMAIGAFDLEIKPEEFTPPDQVRKWVREFPTDLKMNPAALLGPQ